MDSFEFNKLIGALLGVVFVIFSVSLISDAIFHTEAPEKPGYAIEAMEGAAGGAAPAKDEAPVDIRPLLAAADPAKGEAVAKRCQACHSIEKGGPNKVGPDLWGVVGRPIASHEGFSYSSALKDFSKENKNWDFQLLSNFIHNPKKDVPGTAMGFAGLPKPEDRANVLVYLNTQSDAPLPLPKPEDIKAEGGDKAAGDAEGGEKPAAEGDKAGATGEQSNAPKAEGGADQAAPADGAQTAPAPAAPAENKQQPEGQNGTTSNVSPGNEAPGNTSSGEKNPGNPVINAPGTDEGQPATKPSNNAEDGGAAANAPATQPDAADEDQPKVGDTDGPKADPAPDTATTPGSTEPTQRQDEGPEDDQ